MSVGNKQLMDLAVKILTKGTERHSFKTLMIKLCLSGKKKKKKNFPHSHWCEVVSHCGFDLYFPDAK